MLMEDLTFHFSHRLLHTKVLYGLIHKIHHQHKVSISVAAEYAHPLEFAIGNVGPALIPQIILGRRMHFATTWAWIMVRNFESIEGHSGYDFSWSPFRLVPFAAD